MVFGLFASNIYKIRGYWKAHPGFHYARRWESEKTWSSQTFPCSLNTTSYAINLVQPAPKVRVIRWRNARSKQVDVEYDLGERKQRKQR